MGLDTVELVMAVEEAFNLRIPDAVAAKLYTVGELHGYVVSELQRREGPAVDPVEVYETLADRNFKPAVRTKSADHRFT